LINYQRRSDPSGPPHYLSCYRLATFLTAPLAASLVLFWLVTRANPVAVRSWEILPNFYLLILVICFFLPFHVLSGSGRHRFLTTVKRISIGGIAEAQQGKFGDILLADALTSYAKVLGDLFISLCLFFSHSRSSTAHPDRNCGGSLIVPIILAIPSTIRLRQCIIEYQRVQWSNRKLGEYQGTGKTHLANALKYSTAFPVILLSAIQRGNNTLSSTTGGVFLFRTW
jgi:EXS family protein